MKELEALNEKLRIVKLKDRPAEAPLSLPESKTEEYKQYKQRLSEAKQDELPALHADPLYRVHERVLEIQAWKRYKSVEYRNAENNYKIHNAITKLLNYDPIEYKVISELAGTNISNEEEAKVFLAKLRLDPLFELLNDKKSLSSHKYRLPDKVVTTVNHHLIKVAVALIENALEGAAETESKSVYIDHLLIRPYKSYEVHPLFIFTTPFKALIDREARRLVFENNKRTTFVTISGKSDNPEPTFEKIEFSNGLCSIEQVPRRSKKQEGDNQEAEPELREEYRWPNIDIIDYNTKLLPAINRLIVEIKNIKGGNIAKLKVSKKLKIFITAIVEDCLTRLLRLTKELSDMLDIKTFNIENLTIASRIIGIVGE